MPENTASAFSAFRLRKETVRYLQDLKRSYEISYGREFTNDEFIQTMVASVEAGDPSVWDIFCRMRMSQRELEDYAAEIREKKNKK